ncbi:response regulator transcription factor [Aromatoleum evansii]|uniref:Response regulator transcription factor n=1 Tax=Aromatoleum evansii TaxID=59406 RepID=A0ABZ1AJA4_AROEV|nr:response regulator transcription factor [Aromatoleum evansii]
MPCLTLAPPIEVLLVDDQRAILAGVTALIESGGPAMRVAGQAMTGRQAIDLANSIHPDVIILDVDLGGEDGLSLIPRLRDCCAAAIVVFTYHDAPHIRLRSGHLGVDGFASKASSGAELIDAVLNAVRYRD